MRVLLIVGLVLGFGPVMANAQDFPSRPVRMIVPYPPGGPTDILARVVAAKLGNTLGQPVVVDNRPGAGGIVGSDAVAKSSPEGYTVLLGVFDITVNASLYKKLPFDPRRDFTPISLVGVSPLALVVSSTLEATTLADLIALAKRRPGKLTYGSAGTGNITFLGMELFKASQGIDIMPVPYKGIAQALSDLLGGTISMCLVGISATRSQIESGKFRALAVTGTRRTSVLPDVPTFAEAGAPLPDMDLGSWWGVAGPARLHRDVVQKLNQGLVATAAAPEVQAQLAALTIEARSSTPAELAELMRSETEKWARVIERAKLTPE
jgi:tripartite-type tricarboxylate transporter receptor subunit TctC